MDGTRTRPGVSSCSRSRSRRRGERLGGASGVGSPWQTRVSLSARAGPKVCQVGESSRDGGARRSGGSALASASAGIVVEVVSGTGCRGRWKLEMVCVCVCVFVCRVPHAGRGSRGNEGAGLR